MDGRAGSLLVHRGNLVKAIDGGPLVVLNRIDPIYVSFSVPEKRLAEIKSSAAVRAPVVEALVPGEEDRPIRGELSFVDNAVDRTTGTIRLKGTFPNGDRRLWPGLFVKVSLAVGTKTAAIVVPTQAIQAGQSGAFVYVVAADSTAEVRPVVVDGEKGGESVVVQGLKVGERVVTDGQLQLVPGSRTQAKPVTDAAPSKPASASP